MTTSGIRSNDPGNSPHTPSLHGKYERAVDVLVIGAGLSGLCMGIKLRELGLSFVILERARDIGGTWRDNTYPGCACDIPSHLYSFSFEQNPDWTRYYPDQPEILAYLQKCVDKYRFRESILLGAEALEVVFDETAKRWRVRTQGQGTFTARALVAAMGSLSRPAIPNIKGIEQFKGTTFHSARWNHAFDLTRKKVAVIGTGASAVQFIPRIASRVDKLCIFQRSAPWILPKFEVPSRPWLKSMFRLVPGLQRALRSIMYLCQEGLGRGLVKPVLLYPLKRLALRHLSRKLVDASLRRAATPTYPFGCKRIIISNDYYDALARDNVELVTEPIAEIQESSIITQDGKERPFDAIILATGFRTADLLSPMRVLGLNGADLAEAWREGPEAFLGMTVPEFPNFFMLLGPNSLLAHNSMIFMIETQVGYVAQALQCLRDRQASSMIVSKSAHTRFNHTLRERARGTVWTSGCNSWYLDEGGRNTALWPDSSIRYWLRARRFSPHDYSFG